MSENIISESSNDYFWNKSFWLDVASHILTNQSAMFKRILYFTLKFPSEIGPTVNDWHVLIVVEQVALLCMCNSHQVESLLILWSYNNGNSPNSKKLPKWAQNFTQC